MQKSKNNIIYVNKTDSTNRKLQEMATNEKRFPEGTLLWTKEQYSGKGMGENKWDSEKEKNITASFIFYPQFLEPEKQFYLSKTISLGIYDTLKSILPEIDELKIKWPNDILVNNKKIGGILIENQVQGEIIKSCIAGIGINANQTTFGNFSYPATSLKLVTNKSFNIIQTINSLANNIRNRYSQLKQGDLNKLDNDYLNNLYKFNIKSNYYDKKESCEFEGIITGIDSIGRLLLKDKNENIHTYNFKEIIFC